VIHPHFRHAPLGLLTLWLASCAAPQAAPAPANVRWVATPSALAALWSDHESHGVPSEIGFGGAFGQSVLLLKFPDDWRARGVPLKAFIALSPRESAAQADPPLELEVWRVEDDWQPLNLRTWSDKPGLALPRARAPGSVANGEELRIDVTELLRFAAEHPLREFGFAIIGRPSAGHGAHFATGMSGGRSPRLELYLR